MIILDLKNPTNPVVLGTYNPGIFCISVQVVGNRAYLACGDAGLHILDVSDPANPVKLAQFVPENPNAFPWVSKLQVVGNLVYMAASYFLVVDVTDLNNPVEVSRWEGGYVSDCAVVGNRMYLATGGDGVVVFDVTTPANPIRLTRGPSLGQASSLQVDGNRVFTEFGLVDVSDPTAPKQVGAYPEFGSSEADVTVVGDLVYVSGWGGKLHILRYRTGTPQVLGWSAAEHRVIPVGQSEPLGAFSSSGLPVSAQVVSGPATVQNGELTVTAPGTIELKLEQAGNGSFLPVSEKRWINQRVARFSEVGSLAFTTNIYGAKVVGDRAYVGNDRNGLTILDVSDRTRPVLLAPGTGTTNHTFEAEVRGGYAYVASGLAGLRVFDVQNPAKPVSVGEVAAGEALAVRLNGNHAYVTDFQGKRLFIVDVSNPTTPVVLSESPLPGDGRFTLVVGNRAYVASGWGGVVVFDVSNPATPVKETEFFSDHYVRGLAVSGTTAYVPDYYSGHLVAFDLSEPKSPVELGRVLMELTQPRRIEIQGNLAFVVSEGERGGLFALDITDPKRMEILGKIYTGGYARDLQIDGSLFYVADQRSGFHTYRLDQIGFRNGVNASVAAFTPYGLPIPLGGTSDNGSPVKFSVTSGPGRIEGNQLIPTGIGHIALKASTDSNAPYLVGQQSVVVESRPPEIDVRRVGTALEAAWPAGLPLARLQGSEGIQLGAVWSNVMAASQDLEGQTRVALDPTAEQGFFRLWHPFPGVAEPLAASGWNQDVVLENAPEPKAERISDFSGNWFESGLEGFQPGLPADREIRHQRDPRVRYQLQPYTANNALVLTDDQPSGSLVLTTPTACSRLFILSAVDLPEGNLGSIVVHYADGTKSDRLVWVTRNPVGSDLDAEWTPRVFPGVGLSIKPTQLAFSFQQAGYSMFQAEIDLSTGPGAGKAITRVEFIKSFVPNTVTGVYAISGIRIPVQP
jgi:hypothetical protein